jgi:nitrite transporter NirC
MFTDTINKCAANAARIARLSANNPLGFWVSPLWRAYVGLGIILFSPSVTCSTRPFVRW